MERLTVGLFGRVDVEDQTNPFLINNQEYTLEQNILILAYEKPVTLQELSEKLNITSNKLEPIITKLLSNSFLQEQKNTFYTNFIIYNEQNSLQICQNDKKVVEEIYPTFWNDIEESFLQIKNKPYYSTLTEKQQKNLKQFVLIHLMHDITSQIKNLTFPDFDNCEQTPQNTHKNWWGYAYGHKTNQNIIQDWSENGYIVYKLNGCFSYEIENYQNTKKIGFAAYDLSSGRTFTTWWSAPKFIRETDFIKCCHAIYTNNQDQIIDINADFLGAVEHFCKHNILSKTENTISLNIPVLKYTDYTDIQLFFQKESYKLTQKYRQQLKKFFNTKVNCPPHIKNLPDFIKYQENGSYFPMAMMYRATADKYLHNENLSKNPIPAMFFYIDE